MNVKIITDSASDILQSDARKLGIEVLPLKTIFGQEEYLDGVNLSHQDFYKKLIESDVIPTTSQINPFTYEECFEKFKDQEVVCICISKKLSGCYQSANIAASSYPKVRVVDSESVALGEQILVKYAIKLANEGKTSSEIEEILNKVKKDIHVVALLDTLEYLKKGGRISTTQAIAGALLSIKPVIGIIDGEVKIFGKARGSKKGNNMLREYVTNSGGIDFDMPYLTAYTGLSNEMLLKYLEDSKDLYEVDMKDIPITTIGSTIGTHAGPGAIGVAYFKKH